MLQGKLHILAKGHFLKDPRAAGPFLLPKEQPRPSQTRDMLSHGENDTLLPRAGLFLEKKEKKNNFLFQSVFPKFSVLFNKMRLDLESNSCCCAIPVACTHSKSRKAGRDLGRPVPAAWKQQPVQCSRC